MHADEMEDLQQRTQVITRAAGHWRDRCLLRDGSALSDEPVWTRENIEHLVHFYVENLDMGEGTFFEKWKAQLAPSPPGAKKLAAEMLWLMYLVVSENSMQPATKRLQIDKVWGWSGDPLPEDPFLLDEALSNGVSNPGMAFHTHRWRELVFFVRLAERWKQLPVERQKELLGDSWDFGRWVDRQEESSGRQLRHVLLFLLFPEDFESILTSQHKRAIARRWYGEAGGDLASLDLSNRLSVDRAVKQVKEFLSAESDGAEVYFYFDPWVAEWRGEPRDPKEDTTVLVDKQAADAWAQETFSGGRVWAMAAGEGARLWPEFRREGIIAVGMEDLGDLNDYDSKGEIRRALAEARGVDNPVNDALAAWQFSREMALGDYVVAKEGGSRLLGWGVVKSAYRYDPERSEYENVRDVQWRVTGRWSLPSDQRLPTKTLTEFTDNTQWLHMAFALMQGEKPPPRPDPGVGYPLERAMEGLFLSTEKFRNMLDVLGRKKNVILQGPPGVGKSFIARRIAYRLMDAVDDSRVQMVQFHQSYAYEDFVQGYRPTDSGGFKRKDGVFLEFCRRAAKDPESKYVFIIDEINRGNLSRILGELMLLIEGDKRSELYAVPLTYAQGETDTFFIPENVFVLGLMNTADRSLAMVDYALRRRFGFVSLAPEFQSERFTAYLIQAGVEEDLVQKIETRMTALNDEIAADQKNLGPGFEIGHSYFVPSGDEAALDASWFERVVRTEVEPLLREYWFDQPTRVDEYVQQLLT